MEISGKIIEIFETQQINDSFKKREFVVEYRENPQYPELIKFECTQEKCSLLDSYKKGEDVNVSFNLRGRKWTDPQGNDKYFNTLQAWRLSKVAEGTAADNAPAAPAEEPDWLNEEDDGALPF